MPVPHLSEPQQLSPVGFAGLRVCRSASGCAQGHCRGWQQRLGRDRQAPLETAELRRCCKEGQAEVSLDSRVEGETNHGSCSAFTNEPVLLPTSGEVKGGQGPSHSRLHSSDDHINPSVFTVNSVPVPSLRACCSSQLEEPNWE